MTEREMARKKAARKARARKARNRRVALTICLMLVVCVVSVGGTLAWLTDTTGEVKNTFYPSNITLDLDESDNLDFKMIPGKVITKDPEVTINTDVDSWLFVEITESWNDGDADFDEYFDAWTIDDTVDSNTTDANKWTLLESEAEDNDNDGDLDYYVYYRKVTAQAGVDQKFGVIDGNTVTVKTSVNKEMMEAILNPPDPVTSFNPLEEPTLTFKAYAIQQLKTGTVEEAWAKVSN